MTDLRLLLHHFYASPLRQGRGGLSYTFASEKFTLTIVHGIFKKLFEFILHDVQHRVLTGTLKTGKYVATHTGSILVFLFAPILMLETHSKKEFII